MALSKVIKINVTPERWGLVNQTKLGVFTQICRDVPCFLCHFIDARFRCLLQNHSSINKKLSVNRSMNFNAASTNQELQIFCIEPKTGWRHCALRTVTLHSASRIIGTGPILEGTNPIIPLVVGMSTLLSCVRVIPVCWLTIECISGQIPRW